MNARSFHWGVLAASALAATAALAGDLTVHIVAPPSPDGPVRVALFNSAADFPRTALRGEKVDAKDSPLAVVFKDLPAGRYAVSAYQDLNANARLDTGAMGRPSEPYGFSRDARGMFGPASFDDAAFAVGDGDTRIDIKLR